MNGGFVSVPQRRANNINPTFTKVGDTTPPHVIAANRRKMQDLIERTMRGEVPVRVMSLA